MPLHHFGLDCLLGVLAPFLESSFQSQLNLNDGCHWIWTSSSSATATETGMTLVETVVHTMDQSSNQPLSPKTASCKKLMGHPQGSDFNVPQDGMATFFAKTMANPCRMGNEDCARIAKNAFAATIQGSAVSGECNAVNPQFTCSTDFQTKMRWPPLPWPLNLTTETSETKHSLLSTGASVTVADWSTANRDTLGFVWSPSILFFAFVTWLQCWDDKQAVQTV